MLTAERLVGLGRVESVAVCPDGTWMAVAVRSVRSSTETYGGDLWRVDLVDPSHPPVRLTSGRHDDRAPAFREDGSLYFLSDRPVTGEPDEDPRTQVWRFLPVGGEPQVVTDEPLGVLSFRVAGGTLATMAPVWPGVEPDRQRAHDRERAKKGPSMLHYRTRGVRWWDQWLADPAPHVVVRDAEGRGRRDLTPDADRQWRGAAWELSPDGSLVAVAAAFPGDDGVDDRYVALFDVATGARRLVGTRSGVDHFALAFSQDGRELAALVEQRRQPLAPAPQLWVYRTDDGGGAPVVLPERLYPRELRWSNAGRGIFLSGEFEGDVPVVVVDPDSGVWARLTGAGAYVALATGTPDATVYGVHHRITHPPEPFRLVPGTDAQVVAHLSGLDVAEVEARVAVDSFHVPGAGGTPIHVRLVRPAGVERPPVLVWIHGGPIAAFVDGWHWRWSPLVAVERGYAVALPNPRGSTGYGQDFIDGIWGNRWGEDCWTDLRAVFDALAGDPVLDGARMAVMGGSFGGYMANWIGGQTDRFRCLVTHASLYDLGAFHGGTDAPGWFRLELAADPWREPGSFNRYSPHRNVAAWVTPTLILHGEKDYRVPITEALALFEALQVHGVASELVVFPDEGHWILRPRNIVAWYRVVMEFVDRWMRAGA